MPRGDRTGPDGQGAITGRRLGFCAGYPHPGFVNNFVGRGAGRGRGFGRRYGIGFGFRGGRGQMDYPYENYSYPVITEEEELHLLKAQSKNLKKEMEEIQKRISELENNTKK